MRLVTPAPTVTIIASRRYTGIRGGENSLRTLLAAPSARAQLVGIRPGAELPPVPSRLRSRAFLAWLWRARSLLRREVDASGGPVHANDIPAFLAARAAFPRRLVSFHLRDIPGDSGVSRWILRSASRVICVSGDVAMAALDLEPAAMVAIVPNPAPALPGLDHRPPDELVLTCVGAIERRKNQVELVRALSASAHRDRLTLRLLGELLDASMVEAIEAISARGNGPHTELGGYQADAIELVARSAALVSASTREGLPRAILEAASIGVPVIALDVPGVRQVLGPELSRWSVLASMEPREWDRAIDHLGSSEWAAARAARARWLRMNWSAEALWPRFLESVRTR